MTWFIVKLVFNLVLFVSTGFSGIQALRHHTDAGWVAGFVFCSSGSALFGCAHSKRPLIDGPDRSKAEEARA
jgi:hypothetical protein